MTQNSTSARRANWRWLLPILMLILAALACDDQYIDPPHVHWINVDANTPGHAYAYVWSDTSDLSVIYETNDYGQHWQPSEDKVSAMTADAPVFTMSGETLYMNGKAIWSFPRPTFRFFFFDDTSLSSTQFRLVYGNVSAGLQGNTLYASMGTEGVLVGHLTSAGTLEDWQLTANGMDTIHPLQLTITEPAEILGVNAFALFVPPYALIHAFLLYCLWMYLLPRERAKLYAIFTTLGLMAVAAVGIVIWLTDIRTDYFLVVGVVAAITALTGVSGTLVFANNQTDAPQKKWLVLWSLLASLIVPAGVASIFVGWWAVYLLVFGYLLFRRVYWKYFQPEDGIWRERWLVDRLALETVGVGALIVLAVGGIVWILANIGGAVLHFRYGNLFQLIGLVVVIGAAMVLVGRYVSWRLTRIAKAKRDDESNGFIPANLHGDIRVATLGWITASIAASIVTFIGQAIAQGWFTSLLTTPISSVGG